MSAPGGLVRHELFLLGDLVEQLVLDRAVVLAPRTGAAFVHDEVCTEVCTIVATSLALGSWT